MKRIAFFAIVVATLLAPVTVFAQAVGQRTSVGYLNSGYSLGYRGFGGYGFGFSRRVWGGTYGDLLYQQPTQYIDYQKPVYRGEVSSADIARELYNASYDAYGGRLHRTDAWANRIMNARADMGLPAGVISTAPVNASLWLTTHPDQTPSTLASVDETESVATVAPPIAAQIVMDQNATSQSPDSSSKKAPAVTRSVPLHRNSAANDTQPSNPTALLVRPNTSPSVHADRSQQQANATLAGMAVGRGDAAFQRGAYDEAREHYLRATVALSTEAGPHIAHGLACFATGDLSTAAGSLRQGFALAPELAFAEIDLRDLYGDPSDFNRQLETLNEHLDAQPDHADAWFVKGFVSHYTGNDAVARAAFNRYRNQVSEDLLADGFIDRVLARNDSDAAAE